MGGFKEKKNASHNRLYFPGVSKSGKFLKELEKTMVRISSYSKEVIISKRW
jgi:hypothetical protein